MSKLLKYLFVLASIFTSSNLGADTVAIINSTTSSNKISRADVRALFLMRTQRLADGSRVVLFLLPQDSRIHKEFVRQVLDMSPAQYYREWQRISNSGLAAHVQHVASPQEMVARVSRTPNGLGYVDNNNLVVNSGNSDVKILQITD